MVRRDAGPADTIRALLDAGADQDMALVQAASGGLIELVGDLLAKGADVYRYDGLAVGMAALHGHTETGKALLRGRGVFYVDCALFYAAHGGHADTVRASLEAGALGHAAARREAEKNGPAETARVLKNWRSSKRKKRATA